MTVTMPQAIHTPTPQVLYSLPGATAAASASACLLACSSLRFSEANLNPGKRKTSQNFSLTTANPRVSRSP